MRNRHFNEHACAIARITCSIVLIATSASALAFTRQQDDPNQLTPAQQGDLLIGDLRCAACHAGREQGATLEKVAPDLSEVGSRVAPNFLHRFIATPSAVHPGTTMPDMLSDMPDAMRDEVAEALTHFLVSIAKREFRTEPIGLPDPDSGKELFHTIGCVACHSPREVIEVETQEDEDEDEKKPAKKPIAKSESKSLEHVASKYSHQSLSEFLFQPMRVRSSGRMPDMKLTPSESQSIAGYLLEGPRQNQKEIRPSDTLIAMGKKYFHELNCAACHAISDMKPAPLIASIQVLNLSRGCISNSTGNGPRYRLDQSQVHLIAESLNRKQNSDTDQVAISKTLHAFQCNACHVRDGVGGVANDRNVYFRSSEKGLGDDGRIPPPLTLVGAKLQPVWLKKVLFDGESVRPYMTTRMPQFGEPNLRHLPALLGRCDILQEVNLGIPNPESENKAEQEVEKKLRAGGRELLGDQGLNCIACHNFNGKPAPLNKGIDLMTTYQRLQPAWFNNFLRNPGAYRPRIVMPYSWPDDVAAHKTILDGDTEKQIQAIWYYLSLGTSAADPSGIRRQETKLSVTESTRTYRGRSSIAGFRGIAVGFPERLSYAFNAETGTLTALWLGDYIRVDRGGQGSGGFNPSGKAIALAQDVTFVELQDDKSPWPLRPVMTKESPVNPNPLYPKNLGYQFRGYRLDEASIPTFLYQSGSVNIEDRSVATQQNNNLLLKRRIHLHSSTDRQTRWFRVLTGDIEAESPIVYKTRNLRLTIPETEFVLRAASDGSAARELLLKLEIPQGTSTLEFIYEPLEK